VGDIQKRQRHIEDQICLIKVLERDGHNTLEQQAALKFEHKRLGAADATADKAPAEGAHLI
jgi:hypothetical protein